MIEFKNISLLSKPVYNFYNTFYNKGTGGILISISLFRTKNNNYILTYSLGNGNNTFTFLFFLSRTKFAKAIPLYKGADDIYNYSYI